MTEAISTVSQQSLLRLMQLSSASLPVGGYSFSQGLEFAIDTGWVKTAADTRDWIHLALQESLASVDLPLLVRLYDAVENNDVDAFRYWNATVLACRETKELLFTETAMGDALKRLMNSMDIPLPNITNDNDGSNNGQLSLSFIAAFAATGVHWKISVATAQVGYVWSWLENQIAAATKTIPLGQTQAQKLLLELGDTIDDIIDKANDIDDDNIGSSLPGLAMASSWHETQYSRLFRS